VHRPCDRDPLFLGRLARHHLLAACLSEDCPWDAGPEDHIQVDLADHADTTRAISGIAGGWKRLLHALGQQRRYFAEGAGGCEWHDGYRHRDLEPCFPRQLLCAHHDARG